MNRLCELWTPATLLPYVPLIHGFCFGIKREVIDTIGFLDEDNFPRGYGEENDYCFRASDAGFLLVVATHTFVFHAKSKSYPDSTRIALMREASDALDRLHGAHRKLRAVESMEGNPILKQFRRYAAIAMCE
jgi:GT2 family glycosyltransferase